MKICDRTLLRRRPIDADDQYTTPVAAIVADVRARGDAALRDYTARFDRVQLDDLRVQHPERALDLVVPDVLAALRAAAARLEQFHRQQPVHSWMTTNMGGVLGQMVSPLARVGCYVPGGTAPLPSTVLHTVTLARVAGVPEIVVATPPNPDFPDSECVNPVILAAAVIAGATEVVRVGGAQAIAALAHGTASLRPVSKIVGPGNIYVTLAKKLVYGVVGIDGLAGPTETVVVADAEANPAWVAADLLAQAEHDVLASAILLTPSEALARGVQAQVAAQVERLTRAGIITQTFDARSGIVLTHDLAEAVALADEYAPEHLCLAVRDPWVWAPQIKHAGGLFLGEHSFEVLGDYVAGPSHVMPTAGSARFASPLSVLDFVRLTSLVALDPATTARLAPHAATLARAELLDAHANAALRRVESP
ncbi:MAG: histidinol dehydrogenase [Anaerolineales bacterium]|nr:histidinol dehydrogenase [Anaerolineales bacterium]